MKALILVDIQNDFYPGGSLAVPNGDEEIPVANRLQKHFELVVATPAREICASENHRRSSLGGLAQYCHQKGFFLKKGVDDEGFNPGGHPIRLLPGRVARGAERG